MARVELVGQIEAVLPRHLVVGEEQRGAVEGLERRHLPRSDDYLTANRETQAGSRGLSSLEEGEHVLPWGNARSRVCD